MGTRDASLILIFNILYSPLTFLLLVLKAETLDDLYEWKTALENALAQAPSTASAMGQNGILKNDQAEAADGISEQCMLFFFIFNNIHFATLFCAQI